MSIQVIFVTLFYLNTHISTLAYGNKYSYFHVHGNSFIGCYIVVMYYKLENYGFLPYDLLDKVVLIYIKYHVTSLILFVRSDMACLKDLLHVVIQ